VERKDDSLTIVARRPDRDAEMVVTILLVSVMCVFWYRQTAGDGTRSLSAIVVAGWMLLLVPLVFVVNRASQKWQLRAGPETVTVVRRSLFGTRSWSCPRLTFVLGNVEAIEHRGDGVELFPRHFIFLRLGDEIVEFMVGHPEHDLAKVRAQIAGWLDRNAA
jgi:hypothetical protein